MTKEEIEEIENLGYGKVKIAPEHSEDICGNLCKYGKFEGNHDACQVCATNAMLSLHVDDNEIEHIYFVDE